MKKISLFLITIFIGTAFFTSCNLTTAKISDVKMCEQPEGKLCPADQIVFSTNAAELYISCKLNNAPQGTKVKFSWFYLGEEKIFIDEVTLTVEDGRTEYDLNSSLSRPNNGWPIGNYEVRLMIDENEASTIAKTFSIQ